MLDSSCGASWVQLAKTYCSCYCRPLLSPCGPAVAAAAAAAAAPPLLLAQNIGAMQITRVGSRRVVQLGAVCAIIMGLIGEETLGTRVEQAILRPGERVDSDGGKDGGGAEGGRDE
jgi:hypothetical protein